MSREKLRELIRQKQQQKRNRNIQNLREAVEQSNIVRRQYAKPLSVEDLQTLGRIPQKQITIDKENEKSYIDTEESYLQDNNARWIPFSDYKGICNCRNALDNETWVGNCQWCARLLCLACCWSLQSTHYCFRHWCFMVPWQVLKYLLYGFIKLLGLLKKIFWDIDPNSPWRKL